MGIYFNSLNDCIWPLVLTFIAGYLTFALFKRLKYVNIINKIPGFKPFPILGSLNELGFRNSAIARFNISTILFEIRIGCAKIFQKPKMFRMWIGGEVVVFLYGADTVEPLLTSNASINKSPVYDLLHPWLGLGLLTSSDEKWRNRRKMLTATFHFKILEDFLPVMNEQAVVLVDRLMEASKLEWIDVMTPLSLCTLDIICETAMGVRLNVQRNNDSDYLKAIHKVTTCISNRSLKFWLWKDYIYKMTNEGKIFFNCLKSLHGFTEQVISERKSAMLSQQKINGKSNSEENKKRRLAFLDLLLDKHFADESFTEQDIRQEVDTFMFGGHDTTATALSWAIYMIGLHPEIQEKLYEEIQYIFGDDRSRHATTEDIKDLKYLDCVLKESQRLYPSVPGISRQLAEDTIIGGIKVPKSTDCHIFTFALHRDADVFPNPEVFDPDRFLPENAVGRSPYAFVPFSAGPRNCIGQKFALMEEKVLLSFIIRNFVVKSMDQRDSIPVLDEVVLRPFKSIRIQFQPRPLL